MSQTLTTLRSKGLKTKNCVSQTADFMLERGTRQDDPILAYIFVLVLEIASILIKTNNNIESLNICLPIQCVY